ncbi:hypothetical protein LDL08_32760 [Nonomuraea glycinis]|nr:hypothetical protein [Nonomuraea glycinis]MCA2180963.1 hypothetical protein [Nonomuraea glycinis]
MLIGPATMLVVPSAAEAAVPDVVRAVRERLAKGASVEFTQYGSVEINNRNKYTNHTARVFRYNPMQEGTLVLGRGGVVAASITRRVDFNRRLLPLAKERAAEGDPVSRSLISQTRPHRWINTKGRFYTTGRLWTADLPQGRTWARRGNRGAGATAFGDHVINIFEPATLKALIADADKKKFNVPNPSGKTADLKRTGFYSGALTFAELYDLSSTFRQVAGKRPDASYAKTIVNWALYFDAKGLPFQFGSDFSTQEKEKYHTQGGAMTNIVSWGPPRNIAAPRPNQVGVVRAPADGLPEFDDLAEIAQVKAPSSEPAWKSS